MLYRWACTFLLCLGFFGCSYPEEQVLVSPSRVYSVTTEISDNSAGQALRHCVRLKVHENRTGREITFQTHASDVQKWALAWSPSGSLVLYSSDIGTRSYDIKDGLILERSPDDAEKELARNAYQKKYGKRPRF